MDHRLWRQSAAVRPYLVAAVACGVLITGVTIAAAVVLAQLVSGVITDPATRSLSHWSGALWLLTALWAVRALAQWLQGRLSQRGATAAIADLSAQLLRVVATLPPRRLAAERDSAAALITRGLDGLRPYFTSYLPAVLLAGILTPAAVVAIACYDLQAAAIVVIALPLIPVFMVLIGLVTKDRSTAALAAMTTLQSRLLDLVAGIPTLRALGRIAGSSTRIAELGAAHRRSTMSTLRISFLSALVLELLATLGVALVAVSVGMRLVYGEIALSAALTALLLAPEVFWPLRRVGVEFHAAQDGKTAAAKAFALLDNLPACASGNHTIPATGTAVHVDELDADLTPGSVTVLTGPNGCGKSTALQAILGLAEPASGHVTIGEIDLAEVDLPSWWSRVAWLPHRPALMPGTVRANLELFGPLAEFQNTCRAVGFDEVLDELPEGLDTVIGRDGIGLSLGQRQRLGLVRALGSGAPVLLLDEPTAHLDSRLEARVLDTVVERARAGATVVVVGHRDPVLAIADQVVRLPSATERKDRLLVSR